jgi:hypothetical protein
MLVREPELGENVPDCCRRQRQNRNPAMGMDVHLMRVSMCIASAISMAIASTHQSIIHIVASVDGKRCHGRSLAK